LIACLGGQGDPAGAQVVVEDLGGPLADRLFVELVGSLAQLTDDPVMDGGLDR
jgi:hypothetical protein